MRTRAVQGQFLYFVHRLLHHVIRGAKSKRRRGSKSLCTYSLHRDDSHEKSAITEALPPQPPKQNERERELDSCIGQQWRNEDAFHRDNVVDNPFLALTIKEEIEVYNALSGSNGEEVLVKHENSNIEISRNVIQCLSPKRCLNDEVINLYLELLKEREKRYPSKFLKCHFFNTFFYVKLFETGEYNYEAVKKWTAHKQLGYGLLECCSIVVPIHSYNHWCLAVINIKENKIQYFDSLNERGDGVLEALANYIADEAKDKYMKNLDLSTWKREHVEDLPKQSNGYDCGIFMIKYADFHSRGMPLNFSQADILYFRRRTVKEVLRLRAD